VNRRWPLIATETLSELADLDGFRATSCVSSALAWPASTTAPTSTAGDADRG